MKKALLSTTLSSVILFTGAAAQAQVEQVVSITSSNQPALIATIEQYQQSGESEAQSVSLMVHMHDGADPSTHTVVSLYDDLEDLENTLDGRVGSAAWANLGRSFRSSASVTSNMLAIQRRNWGDEFWGEGDYLVAVLVRATSDVAFLAAMDELMSANRVDIPGMIRVMRLRGGPGSHAVLMSASSYEDLVTFQEGIEASAPFATMQQAAAAAPLGATYYKVVKLWD